MIRLEVATEMVQVMLEEEGNCMLGEEADGRMPFGLHASSSFCREDDARVLTQVTYLIDADSDSSVLDSPAAGTDDRRGILLLYTYLVVLSTVRSFLLSP